MRNMAGALLIALGAVLCVVGMTQLVGHLTRLGDAVLPAAEATSQIGGTLFGIVLVLLAYFAVRSGRRRLRSPPSGK